MLICSSHTIPGSSREVSSADAHGMATPEPGSVNDESYAEESNTYMHEFLRDGQIHKVKIVKVPRLQNFLNFEFKIGRNGKNGSSDILADLEI